MAIQVKIGIIGGTGLYDPDILKEQTEIIMKTPFGEPSDVFTQGKINGVPCVLLPRHGKSHLLLPSTINYRANIWAIRELGCTHILATTAVGSLQEKICPGDLLILNEFFDRTNGSRKTTFYDGEANSMKGVLHIPGSDPFCEETRKVLLEACHRVTAGAKYQERDPKHPCYHDGGCVVVIEGPRYSSRTESKFYHKQGFDVVGMTAIPEVMLAKELGLCYASIAMITDWDSWRDGENEVHHEGVMKIFNENAEKVKKILMEAVKIINEGGHDWNRVFEAHKKTIKQGTA